MVEVYKTFHSNGTLDEHYYDTIANPAWFDSVSDKLEELHNYVWKKLKFQSRVVCSLKSILIKLKKNIKSKWVYQKRNGFLNDLLRLAV